MTILAQAFGTDVVLRAANISSVLLGQWIRRGLIIGCRPEADDADRVRTGKQGLRRSFSFNQAVEIAIAAELAREGLPVARAFEAAARFAHSGSGAHEGGGKVRHAGLPFADGETFLAVAGHRSFAFTIDADGLADARQYLGEPFTMTLLNASRVVDRVIAAAGGHPQEEVDLAYERGE